MQACGYKNGNKGEKKKSITFTYAVSNFDVLPLLNFFAFSFKTDPDDQAVYPETVLEDCRAAVYCWCSSLLCPVDSKHPANCWGCWKAATPPWNVQWNPWWKKTKNTSSITFPLAHSLTLPITDSSLQYEQVFGSWWYWWQRFEVLYWPALWRPSTPLRVLHRPTLCTFSLENFHY